MTKPQKARARSTETDGSGTLVVRRVAFGAFIDDSVNTPFVPEMLDMSVVLTVTLLKSVPQGTVNERDVGPDSVA